MKEINKIVKDIIENNKIFNQNEITKILSQKYKISITQSNISRILKIIKAVKVVDENNKKTYYQIQEKLNKKNKWIKELVKKIDDNGYVIVIFSYSGSGNIIGQYLDEKNINNVMGTVSGDNTTLIIPKNVSKIKQLKSEIEKIFQ